MKSSEIEVRSNRKFGLFFTFVFGLEAAYFYMNASMSLAYSMAFASAVLVVVTIVKADVLLPLNKLWMRLGLFLGIIVRPIVLSLIFFGIITPIAVLMRMSGRDHLRLKFNNKASHWISRSAPIQSDSFKQQF
jgi:hypothetical protein